MVEEIKKEGKVCYRCEDCGLFLWKKRVGREV